MIHESPRDRAPRTVAALLLAGALLGSAACGPAGGERRKRPAGSAVWVEPAAATLDSGSARTLRAGGVEEAFVPVADLAAGPGGWSIGRRPGALEEAVPPGTPVTLVVTVAWPPPVDGAAAPSDRSLRRELDGLRAGAEEAGLLPVGIHLSPGGRQAGSAPEPSLDPDPPTEPVADPERIDAFGELLGRWRRALPGDLLLSFGLPRSWLEVEGWAGLARRADFLVPWLYGEAPAGADRRESWDPARLEADLARLAAAETDLLTGLRVVGAVRRLDSAGGLAGVTTEAELGALARNRALRPEVGDAFSGVGRLVHTFQAQRRTAVGPWTLAPGERLRVVRTAPSILHEVRAAVERAAGERSLGVLFHRLPAPGERLTPGPGALIAALGEERPTPRIAAKVAVRSGGGPRTVLAAELENRSPFGTDLGFAEGNYLSVRVDGGTVGRVEPGEFDRYSLWREGREVRAGLGWREPDEVRLQTPLVAAGARVGGARVEIVARRSQPAVEWTGRFYLPDGRELELAPGRLELGAGGGAADGDAR